MLKNRNIRDYIPEKIGKKKQTKQKSKNIYQESKEFQTGTKRKGRSIRSYGTRKNLHRNKSVFVKVYIVAR